MKRKPACLLVAMALPLPAVGQSFNVDIGEPGAGPPARYGAAGDVGHWNSVLAEHNEPFRTGRTPDDYMLIDIHGNQTDVGFHQYGGMDLQDHTESDATGDDAILMNDCLVTHSIQLESCMYLNGLENGRYEVLTYAWFPNHPEAIQKVRFDFHEGFTLIGGDWPGDHAEGVTYSRDIIEVTREHIGFHVGIPAGGDTEVGAAFNGFQLHKIGPPGDGDDDGDVDLDDFNRFSECVSGPVPPATPLPGCIEFDVDADDDVDLGDLAAFQTLYTGPN